MSTAVPRYEHNVFVTQLPMDQGSRGFAIRRTQHLPVLDLKVLEGGFKVWQNEIKRINLSCKR